MARHETSDWGQVRGETEKAIAFHRDCLEELYEVLSPYFTAVIAELAATGKEMKRRPPVALRVPLPGERPAKLVATPLFARSRGTVTPTGTVVLELLQDYPGREGPMGSVNLYLERPAGPFGGDGSAPVQTYLGYVRRDAAAAIPRLADAARELIGSPQEAFARSAEHCCSCGRTLTDPESQKRGIGPECLKRVSHFFALAQAHRLAKEGA